MELTIQRKYNDKGSYWEVTYTSDGSEKTRTMATFEEVSRFVENAPL